MTNIFDFNSASKRITEQRRFEIENQTFIGFMIEKGFSIDQDPIPDGKIHRFGKNKNCWYCFFQSPDGFQAGAVGDWSKNEKHTWNSGGASRECARIIEKMILDSEQERKVRASEAAIEAEKIWIESDKVEDHPYLAKKQIDPVGEIKISRGALILPCRNEEGKIISCQYIYSDGKKKFHPGGKTGGTYSIIPGEGETVICEGYATGVSVHMATGWKVIVAFNSGNLEKVAKIFKDQKPMILGDNDSHLAKNVGKIESESAAELIGSECFIPDDVTDWNDFHEKYGLDKLAEKLKPFAIKRSHHSRHSQNDFSIIDWAGTKAYWGEPEKREYLVDGVFPMGQVTLVASSGGMGKSYSILDLCLGAASYSDKGKTYFGSSLMKSGAAVYISGEDDKIEIHSRLNYLGGGMVDRLYAVPMPSVGGAKFFFRENPSTHEPEYTDEWERLKDQLYAIKDMALIFIDPLQIFCAMDLNKPECAQFCCSEMSRTAFELGAAFGVSHHFRKDEEIVSAAKARAAVRGSAGLIDGVRSAYAFWHIDKGLLQYRELAMAGYDADHMFCGGVIKANGKANRDITFYVRNPENGVIFNASATMSNIDRRSFGDDMVTQVRHAEMHGYPYMRTGKNSFYERSGELLGSLKQLSKTRLERLSKELIDEGKLIQGRIEGNGKVSSWLGIPGGPISRGEGVVKKMGEFNISDYIP